jgi:hypothetical protein
MEGSQMIDRVSSSTPPGTPGAVRPAAPAAEAFKLDLASGGAPASPPPEVLYALDRAQSVLAELASRQVSMHISVDEQTSRIHVELRDAEGKLIREVPASHAAAMLSGERPVGWLSK